MAGNAKKMIALAAAAALAASIVALAGCSSSTSASSASASASSSAASSASTSSATAASSAASSASTSSAAASSTASSTSASSAAAEIANPWSDAASADEAAKGAGLESFPLPGGAIADLGEPFEITYSYMQGMAQARFEFPASAVVVRTASIAEGDSFDISGDYNAYTYEWTANVGNVSVACAGNREGESTKTYWGGEGIAHSLVAEGLGGDESFGLTPERLAVFVKAM